MLDIVFEHNIPFELSIFLVYLATVVLCLCFPCAGHGSGLCGYTVKTPIIGISLEIALNLYMA